ncbi:MAG: hypothetical protein U9R11_01040 [Chloroflexota bacterium]|nr:hypothetical protein [Chloroflexota bacterium]
MDVKTLQVNKEEFCSKGEAIYSRIRGLLEPDHKGEIAAIEVKSGDYFLGQTVVEAGEKAKQRYPNKIFYFVRIGFPAVYRL